MFHIPEVKTRDIYPVVLSPHSCLYDSSTLNERIRKLYAILVEVYLLLSLFGSLCAELFLSQGFLAVWRGNNRNCICVSLQLIIKQVHRHSRHSDLIIQSCPRTSETHTFLVYIHSGPILKR